jgi:hypothetical protein
MGGFVSEERDAELVVEETERDGLSRRGFLVGAAGLTGVALSGVWKGAPALAAEGDSSATSAGPSGGYRFLELDGQVLGTLKSCDGGEAFGEVVPDPPSGEAFTKKHIANVKYEDFTTQLGFGMSKPMYQWIKASFDGKALRKNGAIIAADFDYNAKSRREFQDALITEIGFPACDGAAKDPAFMTLKFAPELTRSKVVAGKVTGQASNQKLFFPSNFRVSIGDLPTSKVNKIDAFTVKQTFTATPGRSIEPAKIEFPNLVITMPESHAWSDWFEDFVIKGNNGQDKELTGKIEFLSTDLTKTLLSLSLSGVGIFHLAPVLPEPNAQPIRRVQAELYCEQMVFEFRPSG